MSIENTVYHNLQKLVWTAFIGVLSFQVIAPNVWGYMNKQAGMPYDWAFWTFIIGYALIIPSLTIFWLIKNKAQLKVCLFPFGDENETDGLCRFLLNAIGWNAVIQIAVCIIFLFGSTSIVFFWFGLTQFLTLVFSLLLLIIGSIISVKRVRLYSDQTSPTTLKLLKGRLWETIIGCGILWLVFAIWGGTYLVQSGKKNYATSKYKADIGFQLLTLKDSLHFINDKIAASKEQAAVLDSRDSLYNIGSQINKMTPSPKANPDPKNKNKTQKKEATKKQEIRLVANPDFLEERDILLGSGANTWNIMEDISNNLDKSDSQLVEKGKEYGTNSSTYKTINKLASNWRVYGEQQCFDFIKRDKTKPWVARLRGDQRQTVYEYALSLENKVKSTAQESLGVRLRDTQLKLIFMLIGVSFPLLALFVFLRIDSFIVNEELQAIAVEKRLINPSDSVGLITVEEKLLQKEKHQLAAVNISSSIWFILTIGIWLIMPLVKPIENKEIDTKSPFKMLTFSSPVDHVINIIQRPNITNYHYPKHDVPIDEEIYSRIHRIDTTVVKAREEVGNATQKVVKEVSGTVNNRAEKIDSVVKDVKETVDLIRR